MEHGLCDLGGERPLELLELRRIARRWRPRHAHEENVTLGVDVLVEVHDVAVVAPDQRGDCGNQAFAVGAVDQQDDICVSWDSTSPRPGPLPQGGRGR